MCAVHMYLKFEVNSTNIMKICFIIRYSLFIIIVRRTNCDFIEMKETTFMLW